MPELGEIRHSRDLNLPGSYYWKWWECELCGKQEWKRTILSPKTLRPETKICRPCNIAVQKRGFNASVHMGEQSKHRRRR